MKQLTLILISICIAGCGIVASSLVYKNNYYATESLSIPGPTPPQPAPPPPPSAYPESNTEMYERMRVPAKAPNAVRPIKIPASKTFSTEVKRIPTIDEATQQIADQLFVTSTGIVADTEASIDETVLVTLVIDPTFTSSGLLERLNSENPDKSVIANETKISSLAQPVLIAPDFIVEPAIAAEQAVTKDSATTWNWQLKPKAGGQFTVIVELYAIVYVGQERTKKKYKTLIQPIMITVPPEPVYMKIWNWIDSKWEWLWTVVLLPVAGLVWTYFKKSRKRKRKK